MVLADLFGLVDALAAEEELGEGEGSALVKEGLELAAVGGIHGDITLVDGKAEDVEDSADDGAVFVCAADVAGRRWCTHCKIFVIGVSSKF